MSGFSDNGNGAGPSPVLGNDRFDEKSPTPKDGSPGPYDDIIGLSRPRSRKHPPMAMAERAAQFAPFAALTAHGEAIRETERLTDEEKALGEEELRQLNQTLAWLRGHLAERPAVVVTYFIPDERKAGGRYETVRGAVRTIDDVNRLLVFADGRTVSLDAVSAMGRMKDAETA